MIAVPCFVLVDVGSAEHQACPKSRQRTLDHPAAQRSFHIELARHSGKAATGNSQQPANTHDSDIIITM
jgi:hypothetical protein